MALLLLQVRYRLAWKTPPNDLPGVSRNQRVPACRFACAAGERQSGSLHLFAAWNLMSDYRFAPICDKRIFSHTDIDEIDGTSALPGDYIHPECCLLLRFTFRNGVYGVSF